MRVDPVVTRLQIMGRKGRSKGKPSSSKEAVVQKRVDSVGYRPPSARRSQGSAMAATPREQVRVRGHGGAGARWRHAASRALALFTASWV